MKILEKENRELGTQNTGLRKLMDQRGSSGNAGVNGGASSVGGVSSSILGGRTSVGSQSQSHQKGTTTSSSNAISSQPNHLTKKIKQLEVTIKSRDLEIERLKQKLIHFLKQKGNQLGVGDCKTVLKPFDAGLIKSTRKELERHHQEMEQMKGLNRVLENDNRRLAESYGHLVEKLVAWNPGKFSVLAREIGIVSSKKNFNNSNNTPSKRSGSSSSITPTVNNANAIFSSSSVKLPNIYDDILGPDPAFRDTGVQCLPDVSSKQVQTSSTSDSTGQTDLESTFFVYFRHVWTLVKELQGSDKNGSESSESQNTTAEKEKEKENDQKLSRLRIEEITDENGRSTGSIYYKPKENSEVTEEELSKELSHISASSSVENPDNQLLSCTNSNGKFISLPFQIQNQKKKIESMFHEIVRELKSHQASHIEVLSNVQKVLRVEKFADIEQEVLCLLKFVDESVAYSRLMQAMQKLLGVQRIEQVIPKLQELL